MKRIVGVCVLVAALAFGAAAVAAPQLRVLASSRSSGDFAVTSTSAEKNNARGLYMRGYGSGLSGFGVVSCSKGIASIGSKTTQLRSMRSGRLYRLRQPFVGDCQIVASLSGRGRIRLQILG
jgi:hypothetical protein